jgi:hypothetical protein
MDTIAIVDIQVKIYLLRTEPQLSNFLLYLISLYIIFEEVMQDKYAQKGNSQSGLYSVNPILICGRYTVLD